MAETKSAKKAKLDMLDNVFEKITSQGAQTAPFETIDQGNYQQVSLNKVVLKESMKGWVQNESLRSVMETASTEEDMQRIFVADRVLSNLPEKDRAAAQKDITSLVMQKSGLKDLIEYASKFDSAERKEYWGTVKGRIDDFVDKTVKKRYFDDVYQRTGRKPVAFRSSISKFFAGVLALVIGAGIYGGIKARDHNTGSLVEHQKKISQYYEELYKGDVQKGIDEGIKQELAKRGLSLDGQIVDLKIPLAIDFSSIITPFKYVSLSNSAEAQKEYDSIKKLSTKSKSSEEAKSMLEEKIKRLEAIETRFPRTEQAIRSHGLIVRLLYDNVMNGSTQSKTAFDKSLEDMLLKYGNSRNLSTMIVHTLVTYVYNVEKAAVVGKGTEAVVSELAYSNTVAHLKALEGKTKDLPINTELNYYIGMILSQQGDLRSAFTDPTLDESETLTFDIKLATSTTPVANYTAAKEAFVKSSRGDLIRVERAGLAMATLEQSIGNTEVATEYLRQSSGLVNGLDYSGKKVSAPPAINYNLDGTMVQVKSPSWFAEADARLAETYIKNGQYDEAKRIVDRMITDVNPASRYYSQATQQKSRIDNELANLAKAKEVERKITIERILFDPNLKIVE